jgi:hypothetical protein
MHGYRRAGSRVAIQLIADQGQVGASLRGAAIDKELWALTSINEVQSLLIKWDLIGRGGGL